MLAEVLSGEATPAQIAATGRGPAGQGRVRRRDDRLRPRHGRPRRPPATCRPAPTSSTPVARAATGCGRSTCPPSPRWWWRRRAPRSASTGAGVVVRRRCGRRARGARGGGGPRPGRRGPLDRRGRAGLLLRAALPPGDAVRRAGPQGARHPHGVQLPRPPGQSGPGPVPGDRGVTTRRWPTRCSACWPPTGHSGPWSSTATTGSTSCPPPGRRPSTSSSGPPTPTDPAGDGTVSVDVYRVDPSDLGLARASLDDLRGGDAPVNADAIRRVVAGDASPHRDIALLNTAAALVVVGRAPRPGRRVSPWPRSRSTPAGPPRCSTISSGSPTRPPALEQPDSVLARSSGASGARRPGRHVTHRLRPTRQTAGAAGTPTVVPADPSDAAHRSSGPGGPAARPPRIGTAGRPRPDGRAAARRSPSVGIRSAGSAIPVRPGAGSAPGPCRRWPGATGPR